MPNIRKVMLVDDEDDIRTIAEISIEQVGGWEAILAASGTEAMDLALREKPDVILLDVMMPGMDGPNTLKKLQEHPETQHIPVIFLTAKVQPGEVSEYLQIGAVGVVAKPFDPMSLPQEVISLVNKHQKN